MVWIFIRVLDELQESIRTRGWVMMARTKVDPRIDTWNVLQAHVFKCGSDASIMRSFTKEPSTI